MRYMNYSKGCLRDRWVIITCVVVLTAAALGFGRTFHSDVDLAGSEDSVVKNMFVTLQGYTR